MGISDLRGALRNIPGAHSLRMTYGEGGKQLFSLQGGAVELPAGTSVGQAAEAIRPMLAKLNSEQPSPAPVERKPDGSNLSRLPISAGKTMSITGASYLGTTIRDRINRTKSNINQVQTDIAASLDEMDKVIAVGNQTAKAISDEAAALQADLAQITNGAPE